MIPQVDIAVSLIDTGYAIPMQTEGDGSTTLGQFGIFGVNPGIAGLNLGDVKNVAHFPAYNSNFGGIAPPFTNFALAGTRGDQATVTAGPVIQEAGGLHIEAGLALILDLTNLFTTGDIGAKTQAWPGVIDYSGTGMANLAIANISNSMSFATCQPIILDDATFAFCISGTAQLGASLPPGKYILIVKTDLSTSGWLPDVMNGTFGLFASCSWLSQGINYQADTSTLPTITTYTVTYNFLTGQAAGILGTGDVSGDAANAFGFLGAPNTGAAFLTQNGIFGIDSASGNDTGCWYCALDCSAFGKVTFTMPDASIGPSSSPTVWNVFQGGNSFLYSQFPQVDNTGAWWWIRLPLCDGAGNIIIEPLTSEVYRSGTAAGPGSITGTFVGVVRPGQVSGGTK